MIKLWTPANTTLYSSTFTVPAGKVCLLFATNFAEEKYRTSAAEMRTPQVACVRRVLDEFVPPEENNLPCNWVYDKDEVSMSKLANDIIHTCDLPWQVSACRNLMFLGVPGVYCLELNDATAIGVAQVYAELYDVDKIPTQVSHLFFT